MMDIKKLFGDSLISKEERHRVAKHDALLQRVATLTAAAASSNPREALVHTASGQAVDAALRSAAESMRQPTLGLGGTDKSPVEQWTEMQKAADEQQERIAMALAWNSYVARPAAPPNNILSLDPAFAAHPLNMSEDQMRKVVFGDVYAMPTTAEQIGKMVGIDTTHNPNVLVNQQGAWQHTSLHDPRPYSEVEREYRDKQLSDSADAAIAHHHRMMRQVAEAREREQQHVEYARRSAEASEENLAAANQRAAVAEAGQARAERRETRMLWITVVAVIIGAIGAGASIWALLK